MTTIVSEEQYGALRQQINDSLQKAGTYKERLKGTHTRYAVAGIVLGALSTFVAGLSAIMQNPLIVDWPFTCAIAGVLALGVTVTTGLQKQLADPELLAEAGECLSRLRALRIEVIEPAYDVEAVRQKYQQVLFDFPKIDL
jgi:hypothetical protein